MSQTALQPQQAQVMDEETAYALVSDRTYVPAFFTKLANDYGIRPQNEEEASAMLEQAAQLRTAYEQEKRASAGANPILAASGQQIAGMLQQAGLNSRDADTDQLIKRAAVEVSHDPELAHAVLSLQAAAMRQSEAGEEAA